MFSSTIIPTIGRSTLDRAVYSVLDQTLSDDDFEIIVVNDSGKPLPPAEWHASERITIINTNKRERSVARNTGAAAAKGRYLHFLDDDDWLDADALKHFYQLTSHTHADWVYGSSQLVDRNEVPLIQLHHKMNGNCFVQVMAGEWIPLQSSLIAADAFFAVGGFNPLIAGPEDVDLSRRIALQGDFAGMEEIVAHIGMGAEGSSTDYARHAERSRWAREKILNEPGVFERVHTSAQSGYWHGRCVRLYLTSLLWNLQHGNVYAALNRGVLGIASIFRAGKNVFSADFWHAIMHRYESQTFLQGFEPSTHLS